MNYLKPEEEVEVLDLVGDKTLIICPRGGIGTRLSIIAGGIYYASQLHLDPIILWEPREDCNAEWLQLFDQKKTESNNIRIWRTLDQLRARGRNTEILFLSYYDYNVDDLDKVIKWHDTIVFSCRDPRLEVHLKHSLDLIGLSPIILNRLANINIDASQMVGLHVRRGDLISNPNLDQKNLRRLIPLEKFIQKIRVLKKDKEKFLLATESNEVNFVLSKHFDITRIPCRQYAANNNIAIQDALISIILLSKTKEIIASQSSFSIVASKINNIKNHMILDGAYV